MLTINKVNRSMYNRRQFRTLARDNCGESMEPSEDEDIYFGYLGHQKLKENLIACGSLKMADLSCTDQSSNDFFHWVTFLFIKDQHKRRGYGRQLLAEIELKAWNFLKRPIRVESARRAVVFFERCGFKSYAEPWQSVCGSSYFRHLHPMEKVCEAHEEEVWDV